MKIKIITYLLYFAILPMFGQAPDITWQQCFGTPAEETQLYNIIKEEKTYLLAMRVAENDTMITNYHGGADAWIVKTDITGNILWEKCYGGSLGEHINKIIPTDDNNYYLFGSSMSYDGDVLNSGPHGYWVVKIDTLGNILWENSYGNDRCDDRDAILMPDGGLLMMGRIMEAGGDVSTYYGVNDLWLCKIDSTGTLEWEKTIGNEGLENATKIKLTEQNTLLMTGGFTQSGGMITCDHHGTNYEDVWILELDLEGNILQQFSFGGNYDDLGLDIITTNEGYVLIAATNSNDGDVIGLHGEPGNFAAYDIWISKVDYTGNLLWQRCLGGYGDEIPYYLTQTGDGGYIIIGLTNSDDGDVSGIHDDPPYYDRDIWMVKLSSEGELEWQHCYGTYYRESLSRHAILKLSDDNFVIGVQTDAGVGGDKTCFRDYPSGTPWPRMAWLFNLKDCSHYQPTPPQGPTGPDTLCHTNDSTSVYTLAPAAGAWGYTWQLQPEEAGTLAQDSLTAAITWNTAYQGEVQISASSYNDCGQSAFSEVKTTFVYTCVGVEEYAANGFGLRVYPNPAKEWVIFDISGTTPSPLGSPGWLSGGLGSNPTTITIYNHTGQLVEKLELNAARTQWNIGSLPCGLYFYHAEQDGKTVVGKLVLRGE